ncbi:GMP synthase [Penaeus vannamei]|uniref:GMP synthase n=1 Tax=Penaeus vannamei TaxID=6689 RepID=A0A423SNJ2_PENVA|nr:GMP synthase [Penaeus vannamei]
MPRAPRIRIPGVLSLQPSSSISELRLLSLFSSLPPSFSQHPLTWFARPPTPTANLLLTPLRHHSRADSGVTYTLTYTLPPAQQIKGQAITGAPYTQHTHHTTSHLIQPKQHSIGLKGDCRTYSYVCTLSCDSDPVWEDILILARLIPKICHNINRVCFAFGGAIKDLVQDITPTTLTPGVLATLRQADFLANQVLAESGFTEKLAQMPVVLIPVHFDRDPVTRLPSCQRSLVLRPFITHDFMTGIPALPGKHIIPELVNKMVAEMLGVPGISRVLYDFTSKPPGTTEWE